ncbi:MAG: C40 family peptidase [Phascolarctobacterium sp.]|nr:C40 family peptidase [Phascolarctobacterium sp.]
MSIDYSDLIGIPFKNRGRDKNTGLDCYGLVMEVFKRFGKTIPEYSEDFNNVEKVSALITSKTAIKSNWAKVDRLAMPVPCLIAMRFGVPPGMVNHTGCYIGNGKFIHIRENIGVCVDNIQSPAWRKVIEGCYEYVGDVNGNDSNS